MEHKQTFAEMSTLFYCVKGMKTELQI